MKSNPLTILLTLKGRHFHTLRWVWHANRIRLPFHVVIADGEVNPIIANIMKNPANFPDLSYEYHQYDDMSLSHFYHKCSDAISRVTTPYTMMNDNDDFPLPTGILRTIEFLKRERCYVGATGGIAGFNIDPRGNSLPPHVLGKLRLLKHRCLPTYCFCDVSHESVIERIKFAASNASPLYYDVFRTEALRLIFDEIKELDFSDLQIHEAFIALRALTVGKAYCDETCITYLRQNGSGMPHSFGIDWAGHLLKSRYTTDFSAMVSCISEHCANADGFDRRFIAEILIESYAVFLRSQLYLLYGHFTRKPSVKTLVRKMLPAWFLDFRSRGYKSLKAHRSDFIKRLQKAGASKDYLDAFTLELRQIEETLEGEGFIDFLHSVVGKDLSVLS